MKATRKPAPPPIAGTEARLGALAELRAMRPRQPQYVDRAAGGKLVAGWNLIVPASLVEGDWEAVS